VLIYWLASNLWTMGQQFYVIRRNPAPGTPAYEAWEERRKEKQARKAAHRPPAAPVADAATNGQTVTRNGKAADTSSSEPTDGEPPRVVRQQPRKQSRSQRRR